MRLDEGVDRKQLQVFVSLLLAYAAKEANPNKLFELSQKLSDGGVSHISVEPPLEVEEDVEEEERQKEAAKRTYARSVAVTKEVINSIRMGRTANVKKVKRAVQAIVDQVLNNEASLVGLTTLRDYDEYTFTHSVNVCIFSVALGRKLGLTKLQLYDLGMAALFHDVGKSRVPLEVLNKQGGLSDEEWRIMQAHPCLGVLTLFGLRGYDQIVVKAFINLIGIYPVGTCVILDTYEVALVHSANPDVTHVHRPVVRIVTTPEGGVQHPGFLADLAQRDAEGNHPRSIV